MNRLIVLLVSALFACSSSGGSGSAPTAPDPPAPTPPPVLSVGGSYNVSLTFTGSSCDAGGEGGADTFVVTHEEGSRDLNVRFDTFSLPGSVNADGSFAVFGTAFVEELLVTVGIQGTFTTSGFTANMTVDGAVRNPDTGFSSPCTFEWSLAGGRQSGVNTIP